MAQIVVYIDLVFCFELGKVVLKTVNLEYIELHLEILQDWGRSERGKENVEEDGLCQNA